MNLYVKNIDDSVTDEYFREQFAKFGNVTSARIMREGPENISRGFGFVCYSNQEEAQRAQAEMNNKMIRSKPITITLHQRKEVRRAQLAQTYGPRNARFAPGGGQAAVPMPYMPMYMPQGGQPNAYPGQQPRPYGYQNPQQGGGYPRGQPSPRGIPFNTAGGRGAAGQPQGAFYQGQGQFSAGGAANQQPGMVGGGMSPKGYPNRMMGANGQPIPGQPQQQQQPGMAAGMQQRPRPMGMAPAAGGAPRGMPATAGRGVGGGGYMTPNGYMQQQPGMSPQQMAMMGQQQPRMGVPVQANMANVSYYYLL